MKFGNIDWSKPDNIVWDKTRIGLPATPPKKETKEEKKPKIAKEKKPKKEITTTWPKGFLRVSPIIFEEVLRSDIDGKTARVLFAIISAMLNQNKDEIALSLTKIQELTGLSRSNISLAIANLPPSLVEVKKNKDKGHVGNIYTRIWQDEQFFIKVTRKAFVYLTHIQAITELKLSLIALNHYCRGFQASLLLIRLADALPTGRKLKHYLDHKTLQLSREIIQKLLMKRSALFESKKVSPGLFKITYRKGLPTGPKPSSGWPKKRDKGFYVHGKQQESDTTRPEFQQERGTTTPEFSEQSGTARVEFSEQSGTARVEFSEQSGTARVEFSEQSGTARAEFSEQSGTARAEFSEQSGTATRNKVEPLLGTKWNRYSEQSGTANFLENGVILDGNFSNENGPFLSTEKEASKKGAIFFLDSFLYLSLDSPQNSVEKVRPDFFKICLESENQSSVLVDCSDLWRFAVDYLSRARKPLALANLILEDGLKRGQCYPGNKYQDRLPIVSMLAYWKKEGGVGFQALLNRVEGRLKKQLATENKQALSEILQLTEKQEAVESEKKKAIVRRFPNDNYPNEIENIFEKLCPPGDFLRNIYDPEKFESREDCLEAIAKLIYRSDEMDEWTKKPFSEWEKDLNGVYATIKKVMFDQRDVKHAYKMP